MQSPNVKLGLYVVMAMLAAAGPFVPATLQGPVAILAAGVIAFKAYTSDPSSIGGDPNQGHAARSVNP
jgi:hypothetical protein